MLAKESWPPPTWQEDTPQVRDLAAALDGAGPAALHPGRAKGFAAAHGVDIDQVSAPCCRTMLSELHSFCLFAGFNHLLTTEGFPLLVPTWLGRDDATASFA